LAAFSYEGFEYAPELGEVAFPHFVRLHYLENKGAD